MRDTTTRVWVFRLRLILASLVLIPVATSANGSDVIDLRDGARTVFYGGQFSGNPPAGDAYGWAMAFGDIDGDGRTDFISSSTNSEGPNDEHTDREHDVYVFFGRPGSEIDSVYAIDDAGVADIVIYRGGFAMTCVDLDRDGYDDLVLAEQGAYVIFGAPRGQLRRVYDFDETYPGYTQPDIAIRGSLFLGGGVRQPYSLFEFGVVLALTSGDFNADGYGDIIIGDVRANTGRTSGGAAFIIFGRPRGEFPQVIDTDPTTLLPHPDVTILGKSSDRYPFHMAVGDFDGDHVDDLVAMTTRGRGDELIAPLAGEIHGFFGKSEWKSVYDMQIEEFDFSFVGIPALVGYRLASGDLDGDGRDELITGSVWTDADATRNTAGEYRIYFGRPRAMWPRWGRVHEMTDVLIIGASHGDVSNHGTPSDWAYAISLATGHYDDDDFDDLLIGAGHARGPDESRGGAGEAYLLRGRPRGLWQPFMDLRDDYDLLVYGADAVPSPGFQFDLLGFATAIGDIDGNGHDDLFMSALHGDGPNNLGSDVGEIYIIYASDSTVVGVDPTRPPISRSTLLPNYPNPFRDATLLRFAAPRGEVVSLTIYDARGRLVGQPLFPEANASEERSITWSGLNDRGENLPSGVYFVKLVAGREKHAQKVLLVR